MKSKKPPQPRLARSKTIVLLTDFGLEDQYVASMKGVILSINPSIHIVDLSHNVQPQNSQEAGYLLWSAYKYFSKGSIFACVVDPGVGSERPIIIARTREYSFLAPDNGLLSFMLSQESSFEVIQVSLQRVGRLVSPEISATFHGRDIFAPIAAHLALGVPIKDLGQQFQLPPIHPLFVQSRNDIVKPVILHVDHFGNIITNIRTSDFSKGEKSIKAFGVGHNLVSRWVRIYAEAPENTPCLIVGSNGLVEISIKNGNAASALSTDLSTALKVYWR